MDDRIKKHLEKIVCNKDEQLVFKDQVIANLKLEC